MPTLLIVNGPSSSGKTSYARKLEDVGAYITASGYGEALDLLAEGFDVVLDDERLTPHHVEVRYF